MKGQRTKRIGDRHPTLDSSRLVRIRTREAGRIKDFIFTVGESPDMEVREAARGYALARGCLGLVELVLARTHLQALVHSLVSQLGKMKPTKVIPL